MKLVGITTSILALICMIEATIPVLPFQIRSNVAEQFSVNDGAKSGRDIRSVQRLQKLDHFNPNDDRTFYQTIYLYDQPYNGGPVFFFITPNIEDFNNWLQNTLVSRIAEETGGVIYGVGPRYYSQSRPTETLSTENLRNYMTVDQIMADYVDFIEYTKGYLPSHKFILFGFEKGASMATWIHQNNPGLVDGVWSVSGPVNVTTDFQEYFEDAFGTVGNLASASCIDKLHEGFDYIYDLVEQGNGSDIQRIFNLALPLNTVNEYEVGMFYYTMSEALATQVAYGSVAAINRICSVLLNPSFATPADGIAYVVHSVVPNIVVNYETTLQLLRDEEWGSLGVMTRNRQAFHMECNFWSWHRTSNTIRPPFNDKFTIDLFAHFCNQVFGITLEDMIAGNEHTNRHEISPDLENVYFTNGGMDPFRLVGITNDLNPKSPADVIEGLGKLFELRSDIQADYSNENLLFVRSRAWDIILGWIYDTTETTTDIIEETTTTPEDN
jgi:hypothetical protein